MLETFCYYLHFPLCIFAHMLTEDTLPISEEVVSNPQISPTAESYGAECAATIAITTDNTSFSYSIFTTPVPAFYLLPYM